MGKEKQVAETPQMDINEVYLLLKIVEAVIPHGTMFSYIRKAALDRLNEIDEELGPPKPEPIPEPEPVEVPTEEEKEPEYAA